MTRIKSAFAIFFLILGICIFSAYSVKYELSEYITKIENIEELVIQQNYNEAVENAKSMSTDWDKTIKFMNSVVRGELLTDISCSVAKIEPYILKENDEFFAETASLKALLIKVINNQLPNWYNIF